MTRWLFRIGIFLCLGFPIAAAIGISAMALMPGCTAGSGGPAAGCHLYGVNLNFFVQLGVVSLVACLITVPIGVVAILLAAVISAFSGRSGNEGPTMRGDALRVEGKGQPVGEPRLPASRTSRSTSSGMKGVQAEQAAVCARLGAMRQMPGAEETLGIALGSLHLRPLHGLRHSPGNGTCGWYVWGGEMSRSPDFFSPLHVAHVAEHAPEFVPYLALPPGWRVLLAPGYEDAWFEERIRDVRG